MLGVTDSQCVVAAVLDATSLALAARARHNKIAANFVPSHCKYTGQAEAAAETQAVAVAQAACQSADGDKDPRFELTRVKGLSAYRSIDIGNCDGRRSRTSIGLVRVHRICAID